MKYRKKLIEVALPLTSINNACRREKSIKLGHPSTLHLWWARRPLAAARAVIFAQMVDDPSTYIDVLRDNTKLRRKAESALKAKIKLWQEAHDLERRAEGTSLSVPASGHAPTLDETLADLERQRLFSIIEELVQWENTTNEQVLNGAREEIWQSWRRTCVDNVDHPQAKELFNREVLPAFHDPFAGGGALPSEAQRLGLEAFASDLNPVAVLINKAMIEIPPRFTDRPPVNPDWQNKRDDEKAMTQWKGSQGLAEDIRYYGQQLQDEAEKRIGPIYPKIKITNAMVQERPDLQPYEDNKLTVIAWLWTRTVTSPNPAFADTEVPLLSTYMLASKTGKETFIEPIIKNGKYKFKVNVGKPEDEEKAKLGTSAGKRNGFKCLISDVPIGYEYIRTEGKAGRMGTRLVAIVCQGKRGRIFISPSDEHEKIALEADPLWKPDCEIPKNHRNFQTPGYGMPTYGDLFTARQLLALNTFSDLLQKVRANVISDAMNVDIDDEAAQENDRSKSATVYGDAINVYLTFALSRLANRISTICIWNRIGEKIEQVFSRQAIPMTWDFAEANVFSGKTGSWSGGLGWIPSCLEKLPTQSGGYASQEDAAIQSIASNKVISTDPPYYDNICYAELSDYFYVWMRRSLKITYPKLFNTIATPKSDELVATPTRHGGKIKAEEFFLNGMTHAMRRLAEQAHPAFPITIYYAYKQSETKNKEGVTRTGWETFLNAVIEAGLMISGTWPVRTERDFGVKTGSNVLASSIVLVCRPLPKGAPTVSRREFQNELKSKLLDSLGSFNSSNISPVDLAQAVIGPGMEIFSKYSRVLDIEGKPISVGTALALINQTVETIQSEQEEDFDLDSRWALLWFEQQGFEQGDFGVAQQLSVSKNTSVEGMIEAGILESGSGKVRILKPKELPEDWDPNNDDRFTQWEAVHHLIRAIESSGENAAAELVTKLGSKAETAKALCYRLYNICEGKKWVSDAASYNSLVQSWPEILRISREQQSQLAPEQSSFLDEEN